MKIACSGSTGLIGSALVPALRMRRHSVLRLVRGRAQSSCDATWNPFASPQELQSTLDGCEAVFHLSGEPIVGLWNDAKKQRIRDSRVDSTRNLALAMAQMPSPPRFWGCASAIGIYGHRADEILTEQSTSGSGFLAPLCEEWEAATQPARDAGVRVVNFRIGIVLSEKGGALAQTLLPFKMGVGGKIGNGRQWMSWIALDDIVGAMLHTLENETLQGPVNLVAPNPVTNAQFTQTLGKVLSRPTLFTVPAAALRLAMGEAADELLLSSARVQPKVLSDSGYSFQFPELEGALRHILQKPS